MQAKGLRGALHGSMILTALDRFSAAVYAAAARSVIGTLLTRYDLDADAPSRSLFSFIGDRAGFAQNISIPRETLPELRRRGQLGRAVGQKTDTAAAARFGTGIRDRRFFPRACIRRSCI